MLGYYNFCYTIIKHKSLFYKISYFLPVYVQKLKLSSCQMAYNIKTFVFMDCETTGLPFEDNNSTKITELTLTVVQCLHIELGVYPRVQDKLRLCVDPRKPINDKAATITKLSNQLLESQPSFSSSTVTLIKNYLQLYAKPICLVAHNGNKFDYPILKAEIEKTGVPFLNDILCVDTLDIARCFHAEDTTPQPKQSLPVIFEDGFDEILIKIADDVENGQKSSNNSKNLSKENENDEFSQTFNGTKVKRKTCTSTGQNNIKAKRLFFQPKVSFKLEDVFKRVTGGHRVENAHTAECDVDMLVRIAASYGERFTKWANKNAKKFDDIPPMTPGKVIGT